jgi:hypothetical protein
MVQRIYINSEQINKRIFYFASTKNISSRREQQPDKDHSHLAG